MSMAYIYIATRCNRTVFYHVYALLKPIYAKSKYDVKVKAVTSYLSTMSNLLLGQG